MTKLRVAVLMGGASGEHEVSLVSGRAVEAALDRKKYDVTPIVISKHGKWEAPLTRRYDVVLPILHGPRGEDGTVQGLLELAGIPYVGAGVVGSAVSMDKDVMKRLFRAAGLPVVPHLCVRRKQWKAGPESVQKLIEESLDYPVFVKPANLGSSVGISKVRGRGELQSAMELAAQYDPKIVVEQGVNARELECAVLGNDAPKASVVGEVVAAKEFYDYEAKYSDVGSRTIVPAKLEFAVTERVRGLALAAFRACEGRGLARVDFFLHRATGAIYVNEINTMPGFTPISMYPKLWEASGVLFPALLDRLIALALERD